MSDLGLDESYRPENQRMLVVSVIIGQTAPMQKFSKRWKAYLADRKVDYFHAKEHNADPRIMPRRTLVPSAGLHTAAFPSAAPKNLKSKRYDNAMPKLWICFFLCLGAVAQERIDDAVNRRIRGEATDHSQLMVTLHKLTDRYGPRLTGSPNHEEAAKWASAKLAEWGLRNVKLEPWEFGHAGWLNERASGFLLAPVRDTLAFEVVAWTPSTNGPTRGLAVRVVPPQSPTLEELNKWLDANRHKVARKLVLVGNAAVVGIAFSPPPKRFDDEEVRARFNPGNISDGPNRPIEVTGKLTANQVNEMIDSWLVANGALVRINDAGREHGQIRVTGNRTFDLAKALPTVVVRNEDFGRIQRLLEGEEVQLEFDVVNRTSPAGKTSYNVIGEIPGSDKPEEVVMLGAHLDSWHSATGATDDAIGCAVIMEAGRIIVALGLRPRRTIRLALWSGEEQGLLGSRAYVRDHFGSEEKPKPEYSRLSVYVNVDGGTGRPRGANIFGPPEAAAVLRAALLPFQDLGVVGARQSISRGDAGSDNSSFTAEGLPGMFLMSDPIEYQSHTWHTNLDTYERIVSKDAVQFSTVLASLAWHLANRDELVPRFPAGKLPARAASAR